MVKRVRINAVVGRKAIRSGNMSSTMADNTRAVRAAMQGIIKNYQRYVNHLEGSSAEIIFEAMLPTFEKSKDYCPKDTGALVESGYLEITSFRGVATVEIGYGKGGNPDYAVTVHENLEWRHKAPTRAKWLQVALAEDAADIQDRILSGYRIAGGFT
jgi:hypothetical protein